MTFVQLLEHYCSIIGLAPKEIFEQARKNPDIYKTWKQGRRPSTQTIIIIVKTYSKHIKNKTYKQLILEAIKSEDY